MRIKKGGNGCTFQSKEEIIYPFSNSFLRIISKIIIYLLLHETEYLHISRSTSDIPSRQKTHAAGHEVSSNRKRSTLSRISIKNEKETAAVSLKKELQCWKCRHPSLFKWSKKQSRCDCPGMYVLGAFQLYARFYQWWCGAYYRDSFYKDFRGSGEVKERKNSPAAGFPLMTVS